MTPSNYSQMLRGLLPRGVAWQAEPGTVMRRLFDGLAVEFSRIHQRALDLIEESDPRTTTELIGEWERSVGLPGKCEQPLTLAGRRAAVVARRTMNQTATLDRIIALATLAGYPSVTLTVFHDVYTCISPCTDPMYDEPWNYGLLVEAPTGADDAFLVCLLQDVTQNHNATRVVFS